MPRSPLAPWTTSFDPADAVHTPRDLNVQNGPPRDTLRSTLADTVADLGAKGPDFSRPLGELQSVTRALQRIALHGGDESEGPFNKLTMKENNNSVPLTATDQIGPTRQLRSRAQRPTPEAALARR